MDALGQDVFRECVVEVDRGDAVHQDDVLSQGLPGLLQRDISLRHRGDGLDAVESAVLRERQEGTAVAIPV